ncbi:TetR/AcrR family transcriptional regulator [Olsenella profusa]|uniref:Transcriptional regulator, TetR family n=1 Tax=Olsenella profusa F0195 TaxID=1125712 RepID=U2V4G5_9ACTN|nr:TetR/AcrR family transcriptional regulator [Olsenella profusa]ERL10242.1 transcriptional regulator, TetR family [Olsenella profusa F0195]
MARDFDKTHKRIVESALDQFGRMGFRGTSIRGICREAGVTNGAFHAHFRSKEELFDQLVKPCVSGFDELYGSMAERYMDIASRGDIIRSLQQSLDSVGELIHFVFEHAAAFRLILQDSGGTRYEHFADDVAQAETKGMMAFMERCKPFLGRQRVLGI